MNWRAEPASEKQKEYLQAFGYQPKPPLTKGEASDLIEQFQNDPERQRVLDENRQAERERKAAQWEQESEDWRNNQAHHLHRSCELAKGKLTSAGKGEIRDAKADLRDAQRERLAFWQAAFRPPDGNEMFPQPLKLYLDHGYRLKPLSNSLLQTILDALDSASATWDRDTPEYLFQTAEYNFPELVRKNIDEEELAFIRRVYGK
jgi:hypothetical protein